MPNTWFKFKQFKIEQKDSAMKVGTDGVLLGAWASLPEAGCKILDVGTGTGLIALMMAQRSTDTTVDAVEVDPSSARQAKENFQDSPWKDRLHCTESSIQEYSRCCKDKYGLIICNPPFFTASLKTASKEKNLARHDDSLNLEDFFRAAVPLMEEKAIISLVLPVGNEARIKELTEPYKLYCRRLTRVKPIPGKPAIRILAEFSISPALCKEAELTIETDQRHVYTSEFQSLVEDFYL